MKFQGWITSTLFQGWITSTLFQGWITSTLFQGWITSTLFGLFAVDYIKGLGAEPALREKVCEVLRAFFHFLQRLFKCYAVTCSVMHQYYHSMLHIVTVQVMTAFDRLTTDIEHFFPMFHTGCDNFRGISRGSQSGGQVLFLCCTEMAAGMEANTTLKQ